jgi:hypothetical protein
MSVEYEYLIILKPELEDNILASQVVDCLGISRIINIFICLCFLNLFQRVVKKSERIIKFKN